MTNDNEPPNIITLRQKQKKQVEYEAVAQVFVKNGLIGLLIKDGEIYLEPAHALHLCMTLVAALRAIKGE